MQRPTGISILAGLLIVLGLLGLLGGISSFGVANMATSAGIAYVPPVALAVANILVGAFGLVVGYGLWFLKRWAWLLAIVAAGLRVVLDILASLGGNWAAGLLGLIVSAAILWYLFRPEVKRAFGRA